MAVVCSEWQTLSSTYDMLVNSNKQAVPRPLGRFCCGGRTCTQARCCGTLNVLTDVSPHPRYLFFCNQQAVSCPSRRFCFVARTTNKGHTSQPAVTMWPWHPCLSLAMTPWRYHSTVRQRRQTARTVRRREQGGQVVSWRCTGTTGQELVATITML